MFVLVAPAFLLVAALVLPLPAFVATVAAADQAVRRGWVTLRLWRTGRLAW